MCLKMQNSQFHSHTLVKRASFVGLSVCLVKSNPAECAIQEEYLVWMPDNALMCFFDDFFFFDMLPGKIFY